MNSRLFVLTIAAGAVLSAQQQAAPARGAGRGNAAPQPPVASLSQRPTGSSLSTIRAGAADNQIWFGWRVGIPTAAFKQLTLSEALAKADTLGVTTVEASSAQKVANEVPKPLDYRLQPGERRAVTHRLRELNQQIGVYRVDNLAADEPSQRKTFEFAKELNISMLLVPEQSAPAGLDKLANEFGIDVAIDSRKDPKSLLASVQKLSKRTGIAADLGAWMHEGIKPVDGLGLVKDKLMLVTVRDRNALGAKGRDVTLGSGASGLPDFFLALFRAGVKPLYITVDATGGADTYADLEKSLAGFEKAMLPAMAARVRQVIDSPAGKIRGPELLPADMKRQIEAGSPRQAIVKPKKPRKLLVTDLQMYSGHSTIPHGNYMLELMAKNTGAFEPTFSNDLELLKYPKIKEFDAIFLNNVCGMIHNDPDVREGILRFVREGGGIGGNHAVTFANNNWAEFADMMGGWAGAHHTEKQVIKIDDPSSPLMKSFGPASFEHTDEFYQFPVYSPYSREKQHVLMSIDVEKSDRATNNTFCTQCTRPDQDYGLAWIKTYGKGRTYFTPLGHTTTMYTDPRWTTHLLAAIQYILGDLDADATPSAKLTSKK